jgi:uncharacterized protein YhjY with autotransporter beta-barrel domain
MNFARTTRANLLLSAAGFGLCAIAAPALANDEPVGRTLLDITSSTLSPHTGAPTGSIETPHTGPDIDIATPTGNGFVSPDDVVETPDITINNGFTPVQAYDPVNVTGIGQLITDSGGGFIGTCTGTLINPRTIIFAAHCVNTRAATAYGANSGGVGIGVGFETNTRANAVGQTDELVRWLLGGTGGAGRFQSNTAQHFYNINQVFYDPRSQAAASCTSATSCFLEADVATAVLDTPANGVPTWALLFSPLPTPGSIDPATGTGYHVNIGGYGSFGTGTTGASSSGNFRRRAAENMLGALVSLNTRNEFLFGTAGSPSRPQQLYFLDFDDPARGTATANPRDFNGFRDDALPREGLTGPGDSGGPLILDRAFSTPVVIGVLSGGSTFFGGQAGGSYGTQSFYQPLFLYWDWIVANNPYRYVSAVAGNRNWEDGAAWVTELDPAYRIITGGQLVNGLPTNLGGANSGNGPEFGELCFQSPNTSPNPTFECYNLATGAFTTNAPTGASDSSAPAVANVAGDADVAAGPDAPQAIPGYSDTVAPAPTLANGLPGATGFVPNNVDGVRTTGAIGRYYDVTLRNTGVVTLNSTVTVDRFTINGATSQLTIASGASLTSLMEIRQNTGTILNNGTLTSSGDYLMLSGLLTGSGTVNAPFTTSVMGSFAPGTIGTTGTLTFNGGLVMTTGAGYLVDLGANGTSDRLVVNGATNQANLGGNLQISYSAATLRAGNRYTIVTAAGGVVGAFNTPATISAILTPELTYTSNSVVLDIEAGNYIDLVPASNVIGSTWARLLDQNRGQQAKFDGLYGPLDLQNASTIISTLGSWAPASETTAQTLGIATTDANSTFIRNRLNGLDPANLGGSLAHYGRPVQVAALNLMPAMGAAPVRSDAATPMIQEGALPETMSGFIAGGYLNGDGAAMSGMGGRDSYSGWYVGAGLEASLGDTSLIGFAFTYTDTDGTASFGGQSAKGEAFQGTLYAKKSFGSVTLDGQVTAGALGVKTQRTAGFLGTNYTLRASDSAMIVGTELGLGFDLGNDAIEIAPRIAGRTTWIDFGSAQEAGGPMALDIDRNDYESYQGRAGLTVAGKSDGLRPFVTATYVHEFGDRPATVGANLVGGTGANVAFALNGQDKDWGEVSGGLTFRTGAVDLSVSADSTFLRSDLSAQTYRGSITFRF